MASVPSAMPRWVFPTPGGPSSVIDEHTRESLLVRAQRRWSSSRVISALADVMVTKGVPEHLRSDNGPEFVAKDLRNWLANTGAKTLYIEPGSPWENGYCEESDLVLQRVGPRFHGKETLAFT